MGQSALLDLSWPCYDHPVSPNSPRGCHNALTILASAVTVKKTEGVSEAGDSEGWEPCCSITFSCPVGPPSLLDTCPLSEGQSLPPQKLYQLF